MGAWEEKEWEGSSGGDGLNELEFREEYVWGASHQEAIFLMG